MQEAGTSSSVRRVPDKCPDISFSANEIERSGFLVEDITLNPLGVADLKIMSQEPSPMSVKVPD